MKSQCSNQQFIRVLLSVVCLAIPWGLGCNDDSSPTVRSAQEEAPIRVSLALDWFPNSNHVGVFEAIAQGYFIEAGLDVNVYTPADPSSILKLVGAGRDEFGISYQPDLLLARSEGIPVVSVISIVQHPLNSLMTLGESGLVRPGMLAGKKVGYPGIPLNEGLLATMLESDGSSIDEIALIDVGFDLVPALLSGTVDAVLGAYWTHESILMELEGHSVNIMRMEDWGVPDFYELILVTSESNLSERADLVKKFVQAFRKGFEFAEVNPQDSVTTLIEANPETINEPLERKGVDLLQPLWTDGVSTFGWQDGERWEHFSDWMKRRGLIDDDLVASSAFTNEFVRNE